MGAPEPSLAPPSSPAGETGLPDPLERRALAYASALGPEFEFTLLARSLGAEEEPLAEALERLVARGLLREKVGGDRFAFVDDARRGQIYRTMTPSRLRVVHRRIGEALEGDGGPTDPAALSELGRHFFLGRDPGRSYRYNLAAAEAAEGRGDKAGAAIHLERARIDGASMPGADPAALARLDERLGRLYLSLGDLRAAARRFSESLERTDPRDRPRQGALWLARAEVAHRLNDPEAAMAGARAARVLFGEVRDASGMAAAHRLLARLSYDRGRYQEALDEGMLALETLRSSSDPSTLGVLSIELGNAFRELDPALLEEAVAWYDRAIEQLATDDSGRARAYLERARAIAIARPIEALDDLARSRAAGEAAKDPLASAWALLEAVPIRLALGRFDEAERDNQLAESLVQTVDAPAPRARARIQAGILREREGRWDEALEHFEEAGRSAARRQDPAVEAEAAFGVARVRAKTGDLPGARAAYGEAARLGLGERRRALAPTFEALGRELEGSTAGAAEEGPASPDRGGGPPA